MKLNITIEKKMSMDFEPKAIADYIADYFADAIMDRITSELEDLISYESEGTVLFTDLDENIKKQMYTHVLADFFDKMAKLSDEYM